MRYDREITYLLGEGLKGADRQLAAGELIAVLTRPKPTAEELDTIDAKLAAESANGALAAYRELRTTLNLATPSMTGTG